MALPPVPAPRSRRVLVVGLGFLGTHIAAGAAAHGHLTRVLTRSTPGSRALAELPPPELLLGDAADPRALERALDGIDDVVFAAGGLLPAASEQDPARDAELTLPPLLTVLDALARRPGTTLTYLSSGGTVYGQPAGLRADESHPPRPIGAYAALRLECERHVQRAREQYGLRARVLRCATVYGEHQCPDRGQGAVATFLRRVEAGEPIVVYGDGRSERDYVYAGDVSETVLALLGREDGPMLLNVGSGTGTSLSELIALVEAQVGRTARVEHRPARAFEARRVVLDVTRVRELTGLVPTSLPEGIARTHRWLAASPAGVGV